MTDVPVPFRPLAWALAAAAILSLCPGCVSVPVGPVEETTSTVERTSRVTGTADGISPSVRREGRDVVVSVYAEGEFRVEHQTVETTSATREKIVTIGLFPGLASCTDGNIIGNGFAAVWYNLCLLGTPTLDGVLVAPFRDPGAEVSGIGGDGLFSRSALLGYHAHVRRLDTTKTETRVASTRVEETKRLPIGPRAVPDWSDWSPTSSGDFRLRDVPAGAPRTFKFVIRVPPSDEFYDLLSPFDSYTCSVPIAE